MASSPTTRTQSAISASCPPSDARRAGRVRDDFGARAPEDDGAEMVVGMVVGEDEPFDRLLVTERIVAEQRFALRAGSPARPPR